MSDEYNDQAASAVDQMTDSISDMLDNTAPTDSATDRPEAPDDEHTQEPEATPEPEPPVPDALKTKIKWQGQEVELPQDEVIRLAQQGFDYTQKTQELSRRQQQIAPIEGLAKQIQTDPNLAKHIAGYFQQQAAPPTPPVFDDPIEELSYKIRQDTLKEVEDRLLKPMMEHQKQLTHQQVITRTQQQVQSDPLYNEVQATMQAYVQSLPPALQRTTYLQLDQDPQAYMEAFTHFKQRLTKSKPSGSQPADTDEPTPPPVPVKKTERAPILESSGKATEAVGDAKKAERVAKLKANALRDGDPAALADWLLQSGAVKHLY